jgi:uncharacterized protein YndB with AHSA1/START domain
MNTTTLTIQATIAADKQKAWEYYTLPEHITQWNFASEDWHCPSATNDLQVGGKYSAHMAAKDGSFGFDFEAIYQEIIPFEKINYTLFDDREVTIYFESQENHTLVTVKFQAESENPLELQQNGWQAILNNYKKYCESH